MVVGSGGGLSSGGGGMWVQMGCMWVQVGVGWYVGSSGGGQGCSSGVFRWGVQVGGSVGGGGVKGQTLGGLKGSKGANFGMGESSAESFCNMSLRFEMD